MKKMYLTENQITEVLRWNPCKPLIATSVIQETHSYEELTRDTWSEISLPPTCQSSRAQVELAVEVASVAFEKGGWRQRSKHDRRTILLKWADLIEADSERLAFINCLETGRSLRSLQEDSLPKAVQVLRWFAECADKQDDRSVHTGDHGADFALVKREAIGVVAAILPWNDPMVTLLWKVAPALAMGNAVIVKPSEFATLVIAEALLLAYQAGVPNEFLQMLTGDGRVGNLLVQQRAVDKVTFTGSSKTAARIGIETHRTGLKRLSFECGGKGAFIFGLKGRNPDEFSNVVALNMFYNQGQICSAPSVVHVPQHLADRITDSICQAALGYAPSHPFADSRVGFMVSRSAVSRIRDRLAILDKSLFMGQINERTTPPDNPDWSITPTVLRGLPEDHLFWDTELFAPVLIIRPYNQLAEAIVHANSSSYGLASGVWSQDIDECIDVAAKLKVGNVHINSWGDDPNQIPFGGVKESGHGREKSLETLDSYTYTKSIYFRPEVSNG